MNNLRKIFKYLILQKNFLEFEGSGSYIIKPSNSKLAEDIESYKTFLHKKFHVFNEILKGYILSDLKMNNIQVINFIFIFSEKFQKQELAIKIYLELVRYHLESSQNNENNEDEIPISIMFKDFVLFCIEAYEKKLPSRKYFERIINEYFLNYYDFAFMLLESLWDNVNTLNQFTERESLYLIFCKLPPIASINFNDYFSQTIKM